MSRKQLDVPFAISALLFVASWVAPRAGGTVPAPRYEYGYVDQAGRMVVDFRYAAATGFSEGVAAVQDRGGSWGYVDARGNELIPPRYAFAAPFAEGVAAACMGSACGWIDHTGRWALQPSFTGVGSFDKGWAPARGVEGKWGFIDQSGSWIVQPQYDEAKTPSDGLAAVGLRGADYNLVWGFVDRSGRLAVPFALSWVGRFKEGLAPVFPVGARAWGFVDRHGRLAIAPQFTSAREFEGGFAPVFNGVRWGCTDRTGRMVTAYLEASPRCQPRPLALLLVPVTGGGCASCSGQAGAKWGFVDAQGRGVIAPQFDVAEDFQEGLAVVGRSI